MGKSLGSRDNCCIQFIDKRSHPLNQAHLIFPRVSVWHQFSEQNHWNPPSFFKVPLLVNINQIFSDLLSHIAVSMCHMQLFSYDSVTSLCSNDPWRQHGIHPAVITASMIIYCLIIDGGWAWLHIEHHRIKRCLLLCRCDFDIQEEFFLLCFDLF